MSEHAFVTWIDPHHVEREILASGIRLPLNIDGDPCRDDVVALSEVRLRARLQADELPVDSGGPRRIRGTICAGHP
jgi:hypothetical protein